MNTTYLIRLQPLSSFYFGSEQNFQEGESYFARSLHFPQQTTLLGLLRYKLLQSHGMLDASNYGKSPNNPKAVPLIGEQSFTTTKCAEEKQYGVIKGLSHLFLMKGDEIFYPGNLDYRYAYRNDASGTSIADRRREYIPTLDGYDVKKPQPVRMVSNSGVELTLDKIFSEAMQVGIFKTKRRFQNRSTTDNDEEEKGFYKQVSYRFRDRVWQFAFLIHLEEDAGKTLLNYVRGDGKRIHIGGERSPFNFSMEECSQDWLTTLSHTGFYTATATAEKTKAILLSDAYVDSHIYDCCDFAVSETVDFRFMETSVHRTQNYHRLADDGSAMKRSGKYNLLQRGSVFYIADEKVDEFKRTMAIPKAFRQIGYNSYLLVNSSVQLNSWILE